MISFPDDYFKDEIRDGFLVSEMMKRTWGSQLEIFDRIRVLCDRYGITYFAEVGTLLGAVRHKGIIPWDDDIDLAMLRDDYMKFLDHADEIGEGLVVRSIYNSESFYNLHAVVTHKADTLKWDDNRMAEYHGCPFICAVDVFPLDYYPKDPKLFQIYTQLYCFAYKQLYDVVAYENTYNGGKLINYEELRRSKGTEQLLQGIKDLKGYVKSHLGIGFSIDPKTSLRNQLSRLTDKVAQTYGRCDSEGVDYAPKLPIGGYGSRPAWCYDEVAELPFEMTTIKVPNGYREALSSHYGPDFMTPVMGAAGHEYPFFKHEVNVLVGGDIGERYVNSPQKKYIAESLDILQEACGNMRDLLNCGKMNPTMALLGQMQELAVEIGNYIEKSCEAGDKITERLSEFCEDIYIAYKKLETADVRENHAEGMNEAGYDLDGGLQLAESLEKRLLTVRRFVYREIHSDIPCRFLDNKHYVLLGMSAAGVVNNTTQEINGLREILDSYVYAGDVQPILTVSGGIIEFLKKTKLAVEGKYLSFINDVKDDDRIILIEDPTSSDIEALLAVCDEYFGDDCRLSRLCVNAGMACNVTDWR